MEEITIKNIGPIHELSIPVPDEGGVVVLRGRNGAGKTHALRATESLVSGKGSIERRDGSLRGEAEGFGAVISVAKQTRRSGELDVISLEGRMSIDELVDPGIKQSEAADARRIRALVKLTGIKADATRFHYLMGGAEAFESVVYPESLATDDLVEMSAKVKRDFESAARQMQELADDESSRAGGCLEAIKGIDLESPHDEWALADSLDAAQRELNHLEARRDFLSEQSKRRLQAQQSLDESIESYDGPSAEDAEASASVAAQEAVDAAENVKRLENELRNATARHQQSSFAHKAALEKTALADRHEAFVSQCRKTIEDLGDVTLIGDDEVKAAQAKVEAARKAAEQGAVIREAIKKSELATKHNEKSHEHELRSAQLRFAARGVDKVLSDAVDCSSLRVEDGLLFTTTDRGDTLYADLSEGERWRIALDIAVARVGERGLIVIPQEAWEGLDGENRAIIAEHAKSCRVTVLTAESSKSGQSPDLHAEVIN